jgi:phage shock protein A
MGDRIMGIFSRFSDIMNANINALLDRAEDPEKMVRMMIVEMEETLVEVRTTSARLLADRKTLQRRQQQLRELSLEWEGKAELAVRKGRDDLARAALQEKHRVAADADAIDRELAEFASHLDKLAADTDQLQAKLADAKARQKSLAMRARAGQTRLEARRRLEGYDTHEAMARFERYERRLDEVEGQVEAFDRARQGRETGTLASEFAALETDDSVEAEFQQLKARVNPA